MQQPETIEGKTPAVNSLASEAVEALEAGSLPNPRHELFARHYAQHGVGNKAAASAGYSTDSQCVFYLTHRPDIVDRVKAIRQLLWEPVIIEQREILGRLSNIVRASIFDVFNVDGTLKPVEEIPEEVLSSIDGLKHKIVTVPGTKGEETEMIREVTMPSKIAAYTLLMKYHKMLGDQVLKVEVNMADEMDKARERRRKAKEETDRRQDGTGGGTSQ